MTTSTGLRYTIRAFITSIGEPTLDLCKWSLERNGFNTVVLNDQTTLAQKLRRIYEMADGDFVRVDADVVPNKNLTPKAVQASYEPNHWWIQFMTWDWFKQNVTHGGVQFIRQRALPFLRANIDQAMQMERPESYVYRLKEFHNPRRCISYPMVMGLQNYKNDIRRIMQTKTRRKQLDLYDFELAERLNELT